jgi:CobQ/CobB/MinD/ParA nucleotide binding domain
MTIQIVVSGGKGGIGKTTISALLGDWFLKRGKAVKLKDADASLGLQTYIDKCSEKGRDINSATSPQIEIIDTAGTTGSALKFVRDANLILIPFKPNVADLEVIIGWFLSLKTEIQNRVIFIPNEIAKVKEQESCMQAIKRIILEEGKGKIISGLATRKAVYPKILDGSKINIFDQKLDDKAKQELNLLMSSIEEILYEAA